MLVSKLLQQKVLMIRNSFILYYRRVIKCAQIDRLSDNRYNILSFDNTFKRSIVYAFHSCIIHLPTCRPNQPSQMCQPKTPLSCLWRLRIVILFIRNVFSFELLYLLKKYIFICLFILFRIRLNSWDWLWVSVLCLWHKTNYHFLLSKIGRVSFIHLLSWKNQWINNFLLPKLRQSHVMTWYDKRFH